MNTVDALKDLYKTLCGKDYAGDPNPTDAEMISAIAKDATTGGGGTDLPLERGTGANSWKSVSATTASGTNSHAEGGSTTASEANSHAEGGGATASGAQSHAEGGSTTASGANSHAEGYGTTASEANSHAEGSGTIAASNNQHVQGTYNIEDNNNKYAHIVGNGTRPNARSNCHTIDWNGNAWFAGSLSLGNVTVTSAQLQSLLNLLNT